MPKHTTETRVPDGAARTGRGLAQMSGGSLLLALLDEFTRWDPSTTELLLLTPVAGTLVTAAQNYAENKGWIKSFLKNQPTRDQNVVDQR